MESKNQNYNLVVQRMFGEDWQNGDEECLQGVYGVMMMLSFLQDSIKPYLDNFFNTLGIPQNILATPFERLTRSGLFSRQFDAYHDKALNYKLTDIEAKCAWGVVGGISSGIIYRNYF